jgi:hypothetical protein
MTLEPMQIGRLAIAHADTPAPPHPRQGDAGVYTWLNLDGTLWGHAYRAGGQAWLSIPYLARFRFGERLGEALAIPNAHVSVDDVVDGYRRYALPLLLHAQGLEVVHASAVVVPGGVLALCGRAQTGKSTTAFALEQRGHALWADDAVAFELRAGVPCALPQPFRLRLRESARQFFAATTSHEAVSIRKGDALREARAPMRIAGVVLLQRADRLEIVPLRAADALAAIMEHAYWYDLREPGRKRQMMDAYAGLVAGAPVWRASFPSDLRRVDELVDALESVGSRAEAA